MAKKSERESKTLGLKLVISALIFYILIYVLAGIMEGSFHHGEDGTLPFEWRLFSPVVFGKPLGMVVFCENQLVHG
jgi:hypothetical protein